MKQDPGDRYIATILSRCDLCGMEVLEIGCGKGRITRDLARHAAHVVAGDPDLAALEAARASVPADNVTFVHAPDGIPDYPPASFDMVIYTLSFHHVPIGEMTASLRKAGEMLRDGGIIAIVEPGDGGSFSEAKVRFGAGSGDERPAREAAIRALQTLDGWVTDETVCFRVLFQFDDDGDFFNSMLPGYREQPETFIDEVRAFLDRYRSAEGIMLDAERKLMVMRKTVD